MSTTITVNPNDRNYTKINNLGYTSYTARERKYEPQTQNTFSFQFLFDAGQVAYIATMANMKNQGNDLVGSTAISKNHAQGLAQINSILNSSMQSITSPTKTIGQIVIDFFNSQIKYAGKPTYSNANITLNTFIGLGSKNVLAAWSELCLKDNTLEGGWARSLPNYTPPAQGSMTDDQYLSLLFPNIGYKCDGLLLECARDGTIVNQWEYIGMWLQTFTPGSYTMAGANTPSQVTGTIVVDRIQQTNLNTLTQGTAYGNYATSVDLDDFNNSWLTPID